MRTLTCEIALRGDCTALDCAGLALREFETLNKPQYMTGVSILPLPESLDVHLEGNRTFRKRVLRARRLGYEVRHFEPKFEYAEMLKINTSAESRQGRRMDDSYVNLKRTEGLMPEVTCPRHHALMYGVYNGSVLRGYASIYRCGDLVHVSQFLGHADYLDDGIMYLLVAEILREQIGNGPGVFFYNRHDSGGEGLRWFKERVGLRSGRVEWLP